MFFAWEVEVRVFEAEIVSCHPSSWVWVVMVFDGLLFPMMIPNL